MLTRVTNRRGMIGVWMKVVRSLYFGLFMIHRMHAEIMYMKNTS